MKKRTLIILVKSVTALCAVLLSLVAFFFHPAHAARAYNGNPFIPTSAILNNGWTVQCGPEHTPLHIAMNSSGNPVIPGYPINTVSPPDPGNPISLVPPHSGGVDGGAGCDGSFVYAHTINRPSIAFTEDFQTTSTICQIATYIPPIDDGAQHARFDVWVNGFAPGSKQEITKWVDWPGKTFNLQGIDSSQQGWLLITPPVNIAPAGSQIDPDGRGAYDVAVTLNTEDDAAPGWQIALDAVAFQCGAGQ